MEVTLDIGKNIVNQLASYAKKEDLDVDHFSINMMELGLRVYSASHEESSKDIDKSLTLLLENNDLLKEIMRCVFDKSKLKNKVYDSETLVTMIENNAKSYSQGLQEGS